MAVVDEIVSFKIRDMVWNLRLRGQEAVISEI